MKCRRQWKGRICHRCPFQKVIPTSSNSLSSKSIGIHSLLACLYRIESDHIVSIEPFDNRRIRCKQHQLGRCRIGPRLPSSFVGWNVHRWLSEVLNPPVETQPHSIWSNYHLRLFINSNYLNFSLCLMISPSPTQSFILKSVITFRSGFNDSNSEIGSFD